MRVFLTGFSFIRHWRIIRLRVIPPKLNFPSYAYTHRKAQEATPKSKENATLHEASCNCPLGTSIKNFTTKKIDKKASIKAQIILAMSNNSCDVILFLPP